MPAPAPPAAENGVPRTELQELQYKAGQVTDEVSIFFIFWYVMWKFSKHFDVMEYRIFCMVAEYNIFVCITSDEIG